MRWTRELASIAASVASLFAGATDADDARIERKPEPSGAAHLEVTGEAISGAHFYLWEEDAGEAHRWATELSWGPQRPPAETSPNEPGGTHRSDA
jgi:hypothetical protein